MANPNRGEVEILSGDKSYTLRLSVNAIVEAETLLDKGINEIIVSLDPATIRIGTLRAILWAGLREHHPNVTLFEVGDLIGAVGADVMGDKIGEALTAAFPETKGDARPQ